MPISLLTNSMAFTAKKHLEDATEQLGRSFERLASGKRIIRSGDDAAGLSIAEALEARLRSLQQAHRNTLDAISLAQVAEGGMNEASNLLLRMRELAIQSSSDTIGDPERELLEIESQEIRAELDRLAESTRYLGIPLLNGQGRDLEFQIGPDNNESNRLLYSASQVDLRSGTLGASNVDLTDRDNARDAIETLDNALQKLGRPRAQIGALQERMHSVTHQLLNQQEAVSTGKSRIVDADLAQEATDALKNEVRQKAAVAVLTQANTEPSLALRLLE